MPDRSHICPIKTVIEGLFWGALFSKYSVNTSVSKNTEVLNTLKCLGPMNIVVL